jgi:hypothetical protein
MTPIRSALSTLSSVALIAALASACGGSTGTDAAPAKVDAKKDAKGGDLEAGAPTDAKDPHAAVNPHAGMPPMMGASAPKGPPRDVTPSGQTVAETLPGIALAVPSEWEKGKPTNSMRVAQWVLPGPGGDAELVVFRFPGGGGGLEANVSRWKGQFQAPEGKTIDDVTTTTTIEGDGIKITIVDVSGTYVAAVTPGADVKHNDANQRMMAAIVEASGDPFYFKAVGPTATMDLWADAFTTMAKGLQPVAAPTPGLTQAEKEALLDAKQAEPGNPDTKAADVKAAEAKAAGDAKKADAKKADAKKADTKKAGG